MLPNAFACYVHVRCTILHMDYACARKGSRLSHKFDHDHTSIWPFIKKHQNFEGV